MRAKCRRRCKRAIGLVILSFFAVGEIAAAPPESRFPFAPPFLAGPADKEPGEALENVEVSPAEERAFGQSCVAAYLDFLKSKKLAATDKGDEAAYLQALVDLLHKQMKNSDRYQRIRVYYVDGDDVEARAFPGGTVFVHRGMLDFVDSEAALVCVLGHELAHIDHGHQLVQLRSAQLARETFSQPQAFASPDLFFQRGMTVVEGFARPFRPEDEAAADRDGVRWACELGYDAQAMVDLFRRMQARADRRRKVEPPAFLRTHPLDAERERATAAQVDDRRREHPDAHRYVGRENLRRRVPRDEQAFDE